MAHNQFVIDKTKPWGIQATNARDALQRALNAMREIRGKAIQAMTNPADAGSPDNANLEAQFGLEAGRGPAFFSELDSTCGALGMPETNPAGQIDRAGVWAALLQFIDQVG